MRKIISLSLLTLLALFGACSDNVDQWDNDISMNGVATNIQTSLGSANYHKTNIAKIAGGVAPYTVTSSDEGVAVAMMDGDLLYYTMVGDGDTDIIIEDSKGQRRKLEIRYSGKSKPQYIKEDDVYYQEVGKKLVFDIKEHTGNVSIRQLNEVAVESKVVGDKLEATIVGNGKTVIMLDDQGNVIGFQSHNISSTPANSLFVKEVTDFTMKNLVPSVFVFGEVGKEYDREFINSNGVLSVEVDNEAIATATWVREHIRYPRLVIKALSAGDTSITVKDSSGRSIKLHVSMK